MNSHLLTGLYREFDVAPELGSKDEGELYINLRNSQTSIRFIIQGVLILIMCPGRGWLPPWRPTELR